MIHEMGMLIWLVSQHDNTDKPTVGFLALYSSKVISWGSSSTGALSSSGVSSLQSHTNTVTTIGQTVGALYTQSLLAVS